MGKRWISGRWLPGQGRGAVAALLVSLAGAGFSAHAGRDLPALAAPRPSPIPVGYEAQDHFPGAALLYVDTPLATPAKGVTGTVALPDLPPEAAQFAGAASIQPASPWVLRGSQLDKARALQCLTTAIYYEAASEPDDGQAAVAQVILNRARHPTFPGTVCGVVYQGSERRGCQFSFACDGALARLPMRSAWLRAQRAAARALAGYVFAPVGMATHYHTYAVTPAWNRSLVMTGVFGAHFFHRWKGWWGTAAAFTRSYVGGEPMPGPHAPIETPAPLTPVIIAAALPARPAPILPEVQPQHVASGTVQEQYATSDSQILDKWKDSGKPLR
ncbi:cell wall hydrolase [Sphingomonas donggukensis]|uniref:Cell wall hydrolase n=1 Tax=Sphingomonas donggukensis TaxID=2949093 RepID=A0ABY4TVY8_9SPHN|nr:cell wall hydrolase [Sphingomonas donggukensis]URW76045.1 cell wall hydrolase [Sphingomonas donggukensis]